MMYTARINGKWYAFEKRGHNVYSIGRDNPKSGRWTALFGAEGIKYVASQSPTKNAAYQKARRAAIDALENDGWQIDDEATWQDYYGDWINFD